MSGILKSGHWSRHRFTTLLALLLLLIATAPGLDLLRSETHPWVNSAIFTFTFSAVLVWSVFAVEGGKHARRTSMALAITTIVLRILTGVFGGTALTALSHLSAALFLGLIIFFIVRLVFTAKLADMNTIAGSLCAYMLLGVLYAVLFSMVGTLDPGAFRMAGLDQHMRLDGANSITPIYFSFVTLTTLGYGDLVPVSPVARTLVLVETLVGQIFMIVLVSRLVGINVAQNTSGGAP